MACFLKDSVQEELWPSLEKVAACSGYKVEEEVQKPKFIQRQQKGEIFIVRLMVGTEGQER